MRFVAWMLGLIIAIGLVYVARRAYAQWQERSRASEARMANVLAEARMAAMPAGAAAAVSAAPVAPPKQSVLERLLFDAAASTAQAGEPALAIQIYARLLSRFPQSALAAQARAAVAEQKAKLAKA
jgi:TolA-binding protein